MKLELSFPVRIILLLGLIVSIPLVILGTTYLAQGNVSFSSAIPNAYVVDTETEVRHDLPVTLQKRAGKHVMTLSAAGYASEDVVVRFPSFRLTKEYEVTLTRQLYDEEDPDALKKIPLASELPYRTTDFEIELPEENGVYPILLSPTLITVPGVSVEALDASLNEDKVKALQWLASKGVKESDIKIKWLPYDPDAPL